MGEAISTQHSINRSTDQIKKQKLEILEEGCPRVCVSAERNRHVSGEFV
jgi:hypothetical protein